MTFDLNIENYTRDELIEMFELPTHFDKNIVDIKETKLRENILNNTSINDETRNKTILFLTKAKNIIMNYSNGENLFQKKIENFYNTSYDLKPVKIEENDDHMIQMRKNKPYLSSYPSEFFPGIINPMKKRTIKKNLNIDSRFRENYYLSASTNFNIVLPTQFNDVLQMQLSAIELPTTYYVISKQYGNNFFTISVNNQTTIITIPSGNYTYATIMETINTQLTLAGGDFLFITFQSNMDGNATGSGQTIVGPNGIGSVTSIEINFQNDRNGNEDKNTPLPLKMGWLLGFRNGKYEGNLNYVSEGLLDLTGPKYFFLVLDDYNNNVNNNFFSAFNSSVLNKNILARISLSANNFDILLQNNLRLITTPREYFGPVNIQNITIQLLDEYGRIVDLNNMDFSFCVTLTNVYDI